MLRALLLAATTLSAGYSAGKKALNKEIGKRKASLIQESAEQARAEIKHQSGTFLAQMTRRIARNATLRLIFLAILWGLTTASLLSKDIFLISASAGLAVFLAVDVWRSWPTLRLVFSELRTHNWNPKRALSEMIAASVFDQVMSQASDYPLGRTHRLLLGVAGESPEAIAKEVATAVADLSKQTSWSDMRPFLLLASINISTFWIFYIAAMWLVMNAV